MKKLMIVMGVFVFMVIFVMVDGLVVLNVVGIWFSLINF